MEGTSSPHGRSPGGSPGGAAESRGSSSRAGRRGPSPDALERRRRQNRASQLAFRERSKKALEEMKIELTSAEERNKKLVGTLGDLLRQADSLKNSIEQALAEHGGVGHGVLSLEGKE